jgi:hypothetical protein
VKKTLIKKIIKNQKKTMRKDKLTGKESKNSLNHSLIKISNKTKTKVNIKNLIRKILTKKISIKKTKENS